MLRSKTLTHGEDMPRAALRERLRAELVHDFGAPESSYAPLTAAEVIARNRA